MVTFAHPEGDCDGFRPDKESRGAICVALAHREGRSDEFRRETGLGTSICVPVAHPEGRIDEFRLEAEPWGPICVPVAHPEGESEEIARRAVLPRAAHRRLVRRRVTRRDYVGATNFGVRLPVMTMKSTVTLASVLTTTCTPNSFSRSATLCGKSASAPL